MGAISNISFWGSALTGTGPHRGATRPNAAPDGPRIHRGGGGALAVAAAVALLLTAPALAEESRGEGGNPGLESATDTERPVSTSPQPRAPTPEDALAPISGNAAPTPALTRAAARERIDSMSPIGWLEGFGDVRVGRIR